MPNTSFQRTRVPQGVTTGLHRLHGIVERYLILEGIGTVEIGNLGRQQVQPGDMAIIPSECPQRVSNTGTSDLVFIAICTPRFTPSAYEDLEQGDHERGA